MKIQCDVCNKNEASVFCSADEAALCDACDYRVHHANKLASKHQRFSLVHPSQKQFPLCDICQDKRAFLFCQQDRALLCRDCDIPIHTANEHTLKHNRFLLTGIKLSATSALYSSTTTTPTPTTTTTTTTCDSVPNLKSNNKPISVSSQISHPPSINNTSNSSIRSENQLPNDVGSTSSISEYLIETLPGWHVEDFLDSSNTPFGFSKNNDGLLSFLDSDFESNLTPFSSENIGIWVPQASPVPQANNTQYSSYTNGQNIGFKDTTMMKSSRRWSDDGFTVPQISPQSTCSKRHRTLW